MIIIKHHKNTWKQTDKTLQVFQILFNALDNLIFSVYPSYPIRRVPHILKYESSLL